MKPILSILVTLYSFSGFSNISNPDSLITLYSDSIRQIKMTSPSNDSLFHYNYQLGKYYFKKAKNIYAKEGRVSDENLRNNYPWLELDSAIYFLNTSIAQNKKHAASFYYRGVAQEFQDGNRKLILKDYTRAIKLSRTTWEYYLNRANYLSSFEPKKAVQDYTSAIELNPSFYESYMRRACAFASLDPADVYSERIEKDFSIALQLNCDSTRVFLTRGSVRMHDLKNYQGAIADFSLVIQRNPENKRAYYNRATAYYLNEQHDLACSDFKRYKVLGGSVWVYYIKTVCGLSYEQWNSLE